MDTSTLARARELYLAGDLPALDDVPCVCERPRSAHSGATRAGGCEASGCLRYRADRIVLLAVEAAAAGERSFHQHLAEFDRRTRARVKKKRPGSVNVRPSDIGGCDREVYYRETPPEDFYSSPTRRGAAWMGGIIHEEYMRRLAQLYPWLMFGDRKGFELVLPGMERPSKYDIYDPIRAHLQSIKTAGRWQWDQVGERGADDKWWDQDHLYAMVLRDLGFPVETIEVLVIERADGNSERFTMDFDPERAERALAKIHDLAMTLELGVVPERGRSGPTTDPLCRNCFARDYCWNIPQATAAGRSPESYTVLGTDPEDADIIAIAEQLIEARAEQNDAKGRVDRYKALLDGVELRHYVDPEDPERAFEGYARGGRTETQWEEWAEEMRRIATLPADQRPEQLPEPRQTKTRSSVTWGRMRKATRERLKKEKEARDRETQQALRGSVAEAS